MVKAEKCVVLSRDLDVTALVDLGETVSATLELTVPPGYDSLHVTRIVAEPNFVVRQPIVVDASVLFERFLSCAADVDGGYHAMPRHGFAVGTVVVEPRQMFPGATVRFGAYRSSGKTMLTFRAMPPPTHLSPVQDTPAGGAAAKALRITLLCQAVPAA
jgi:hypothetical protein